MAWLQFKLTAEPGMADALTARLEGLGALAVTYEADESVADALFDEPGLSSGMDLWERFVLTALFPEAADPQAILSAMHDLAPGFSGVSFEGLADRDWSRVWMERFVPLQFGERCWIVPSWCEPPDPAAVNVFIEPGMAFGTGTHATTALCLEWLARQRLQADSLVLDFGCGSGILAIAAAKLGAGTVYAVDVDAQALSVAQENARQNQVTLAVCAPAQLPAIQADFLVANILLAPLLQLAPKFAGMVRTGGAVALSGLLLEQLAECRQAYSPWFELTDRCERDGWGLLGGTRRANSAAEA